MLTKQMQFKLEAIQARHHMQHATTYHTAKLEQAPVMVVKGKCALQVQSYVQYLHLGLLFFENHVERMKLHSL